MRIIVLLITLTLSLLAKDIGELSFYLLKDGIPMANQEVIIYKKAKFISLEDPQDYVKHTEVRTDSDGQVYTELEVGSYQLHVIAKENTQHQAYVKKHFLIEKNKESQIIVSLKKNNTLAFEDDESSKVVQEVKKVKKKQINGHIQISLISSENEKPIKNARIFVKGMSIDVKSDAKGNTLLTLPAGEQVLSIIHSEFSSQTIKVLVPANDTVTKFVELTPASMELDEFIVLAPQIEGSVASLVAERRNSSAISDILGSEEMSKKGDSNAASALKRVSGVTLVDGKNVFVRGLGERYANVELNSMHLPSPDPYKRVVPLNIFPSSVIGSLKVQKTYSADLSGNFGGGYIDLRTKEAVTEDYVKLTLATKAHDSALKGTQGDFYSGGAFDTFGFDDGSRAIPSNILNAGEVVVGERPPTFSPYGTDALEGMEIWGMTKDLARRSVNTHKADVPFGGKFALEIGKKIDINKDHTLSILANYSYDQNHKTIIEDFWGYSMDGSGNIASESDTQGSTQRTYSNYKQNAMLNLGYNYADIFKLKYTSLYVLDTLERTRVSEGIIGSNQDLQKLYSLDWEEKTLFANQLTGTLKHHIGVDLQLNFGTQWSMAKLYQPDNVKYEYIDYSGTGDSFQLKTQSAQNMIHHRLETDDVVQSIYLNEVADVNIFDKADKIEVGVTLTDKTRESRSDKFFLKANQATNISFEDSQLDPDSILDKYVTNEASNYETSTFLVNPLFSPSDYYDADLIETGLYVKTLLNPTKKLEVSLGLRKADLKQTLHEYRIDPSTNLVVIEDNVLEVNKILPNLDLRYKIDSDNQIRFGYSQTYIYPDFREFSSSGYFHPDEAATVIGNPNLTHTDIVNYDLRYEHYFSPTEGFSTALFYKELDNPIEDISRPTTSLPIYSYENTDAASIMGMELEASSKLEFLSDALKNYYVSANLTFTKSEVSLSSEQQEEFTTNQRELQGLSPIVINATLGYDNTNGRIVNLSYNYMSERLRKVGLKNGIQEYPDQYEHPPHVLDLAWQEKIIENMSLKFKASNLIDGKVIWTEGENVVKSYKLGRSYEISLNYKF